MFDPVSLIKEKSAKDYSGIVRFGEFTAFLDSGVLLHVQNQNDTMWLLRRMVCCGLISEGYAHNLRISQEYLTLQFFPFLSNEDWLLLIEDRARQNLFDLSFLVVESSIEQPFEPFYRPLQKYDTQELLQEIEGHRQGLYFLRSRIQELWVKKSKGIPSHPLLDSCPQTFALHELMVQSPWEELQLLLEIKTLLKEGHIQISENPGTNFSPLTEEEESLFSDHDRSKQESHFVIAKENLEKVVIAKHGDSPKIDGMLYDANDLLRTIANSFEASAIQDWLRELVENSPRPHREFFSIVRIQGDGTLVLVGNPAAITTLQALGSLLLRAARSPLVVGGRREFITAIGKWGQKWSI